MSTKSKPAEPTADREVITTRRFDASRERVFGVFSDPKQLALCWGPNGFTNTIQQFDFQPGGTWRLTMHGPDGTDYDNESKFIEIVKPARLVFRHFGPMHQFQMTMVFDEEADGTRLTWYMRFDSAAECEPIRKFIADANEQNFDRLGAHLAKTK